MDTADAAIDSITDVFPLFFSNPEAGRRRDDVARGVRSFPADKYLIYYRSAGGSVVISRVIHGMRDQRRAFHWND